MEYKKVKYPKHYPKNFGGLFYPNSNFFNNSDYTIFFTTTKYSILYNNTTKERKRRKCTDEDRAKIQIEKDYYKKFFNLK